MAPARIVALVAALTALATLLAGAPVGPAHASQEAERGWLVDAVRIEPIDPVPLTAEGIGTFRGGLEMRASADGLAVINDVGLDDYLKGIAEVPPSWPEAALQAQVIAARTYVLWQRAVPSPAAWRAAGAHICATQSCQVYRGIAGEERQGAERWAAAVDATAGQLLLWEGRLIKAMYSSSNGGRSEYGGVPWLPEVDDPDDLEVSPHATWRSVLPLSRVDAAFPAPGRLVGVERSAEVVVLRRQADDGSTSEQGIAPNAFRKAMNEGPAPSGVPVAVPSVRFTAKTSGGNVVLDGGGFGHLLGMSQFGAMGKAERGLSAAEILAAYYAVSPTALAPEQLPPTIKVAIAMDRPDVTVTAGGWFRVIASGGEVLAGLTSGSWTVRAEDGRVRVLPPEGYDGTLNLAVLSVTAGPPPAGGGPAPTVARVALSAPATLRAATPTAGTVDLGRFGPGEHDVTITGLPAVPGAAAILVADGGAGKVAQAEIVVADPDDAPVTTVSADAGQPFTLEVAQVPPAGSASTAGTVDRRLTPAGVAIIAVALAWGALLFVVRRSGTGALAAQPRR